MTFRDFISLDGENKLKGPIFGVEALRDDAPFEKAGPLANVKTFEALRALTFEFKSFAGCKPFFKVEASDGTKFADKVDAFVDLGTSGGAEVNFVSKSTDDTELTFEVDAFDDFVDPFKLLTFLMNFVSQESRWPSDSPITA